jgi:hypothetical protein
MLYHATSLGQARDAIAAFIKILGEDAPIGCFRPLAVVSTDGTPTGEKKGFIDEILALEWVCIKKDDGTVVGTEADDYESKLKPGEINAIALS